MERVSLSQKTHFEKLHDQYNAHYFDKTSMEFRDNFIYKQLFKNLDLNNKLIADLACGNGDNSKALLEKFPNADVIGFDISSKACEAYRKNLNKDAYQVDLTLGNNLDIQVDVAMIIGGIHHCASDLAGTFKTINHLLKPGGLLLMYEPNKLCFLEIFRKIWYKVDDFFQADSEAALNHDEILKIAGPNFSLLGCVYMGGPAYFLIYNSLILRVPLWLKPKIAKPLFLMESMYNLLPGKILFPYFIARWKK